MTFEVGDVVTHSYWGKETWTIIRVKKDYFLLKSCKDRGEILSGLYEMNLVRKATKLEKALR